MTSHQIFLFGLLALAFSVALADNNALCDFCVADVKSHVLVNGAACKDPKEVTADDFFFTGFDKAGNTSNPSGSKITAVNVNQVPGLNTLGLSLVRIDFAPLGVNPPHTHPRASEILVVLEGSLEVGFITSSPDYRHITKVLQKGEVFVFPVGLVHYQRNIAKTNAVAFAALNSQNPGVIGLSLALFSTKPALNSDVLGKSLQMDKKTVDNMEKKFT